MFYIYLKDKEDVTLKNLLQGKIDEYSEFSSCDYIRERGIAFPELIEKSEFESEFKDMKNKAAFETPDNEKLIVFSSKYCFKEESGLFG